MMIYKEEATFNYLKIYDEMTILYPLNPKYSNIEVKKGDRQHLGVKIVEKKKRS